MSKPFVIAITMGDPGGVGPEIIAKALKKERPASSCAFLVIGTREVCERLRKRIGLFLSFREWNGMGKAALKGGGIYFLDISKGLRQGGKFQIGKISVENGSLALAAIERAARLAKQKIIQAIVTAPVNKAAMRLVDKKFIGHTEFFAQKEKVKNYAMMFSSSKLKVTLATIHVPLKKVSMLLSAKGIEEKILLTHDALRRGFDIKKPRLAVCALNPHGKEAGIEEGKTIEPAVRRAQKKGVDVVGPQSADQLFHAAYTGKYDALICMYHDQALGPFKMVAFNEGVNITLGLPYVRTSPDHGTAFDIAYQDKADPSSMLAALRLAKSLTLSRYAHAD
ncbi:MAG TPA: 4-hydroxythreonine-4-phosphate dehydrogenase PdxA [Candidatus Omnitrophota bacterium]|nr:4-hydroxythreonine-4-phosphate dehydrogenase PdxA [Candidatus Omnitrophota bacterium]